MRRAPEARARARRWQGSWSWTTIVRQRRRDAVLVAVIEVDVAQRSGVVAAEDFVVVAEVLHRAEGEDVDDHRLVADDRPRGDVADRLIDVAARSDELAGVEPALSRQRERVHFAEVAVARDDRAGLDAQ